MPSYMESVTEFCEHENKKSFDYYFIMVESTISQWKRGYASDRLQPSLRDFARLMGLD